MSGSITLSRVTGPPFIRIVTRENICSPFTMSAQLPPVSSVALVRGPPGENNSAGLGVLVSLAESPCSLPGDVFLTSHAKATGLQ